MDTARYEALASKRNAVGLSDDEAAELGQMIAEIERRAETSLQPCGHVGCGCDIPAGFCSDYCRGHFEAPAPPQPLEDCGCGHDSCRRVAAS